MRARKRDNTAVCFEPQGFLGAQRNHHRGACARAAGHGLLRAALARRPIAIAILRIVVVAVAVVLCGGAPGKRNEKARDPLAQNEADVLAD